VQLARRQVDLAEIEPLAVEDHPDRAEQLAAQPERRILHRLRHGRRQLVLAMRQQILALLELGVRRVESFDELVLELHVAARIHHGAPPERARARMPRARGAAWYLSVVHTTGLGIVLGILLGLRHAFEPDHLTAISTLVGETRGLRGGALLGALWGIGHTISLVLVAVVLMLIGASLPE